MTSKRHNPDAEPTPEDGYLDAARDTILAVGWRRTTLTDVARRAGVSRMTIYRRWPDMRSLLADLLVREWGGVIDAGLVHARASDGETAEGTGGGPGPIARGVVTTVAALRENELFRKILEVDPELLLPYLIERRGRNQDLVLDLLTAAVAAGQADGSVRAGDPALLARALLLAVQGFVISAPTMADLPADRLDEELVLIVERYLLP